MSYLSGLDVVVVRERSSDAVHRSLAHLARQRRAPATVTVVDHGSGRATVSAPAVGVVPGATGGAGTVDLRDVLSPAGLRPWTLVLRAGDAPTPDALVVLESLTDGLGPGAVLVRLVPSTGAVERSAPPPFEPELTRLLLHRDWPGRRVGGPALPTSAWDALIRAVAAGSSQPPVMLSETVVAPLGLATGPDALGPTACAEGPITTTGLAVVVVGGALVLPPQRPSVGAADVPTLAAASWDATALAAAAAVTTEPLVAVLDAEAAAVVVDATFVAKCVLRAGAGVQLALLVAAGDGGARWRPVPLEPGDEHTVLGFSCERAALLGATERAGAGGEEVLETLVRWAAGAGPGAVRAHAFPIVGATGLRLRLATLPPGTGRSVGPGPADGPDGPVRRTALPATRASWSPAGSLPLELVGDPATGAVALSSALAPLPPQAWTLRVVIGAVDRWPFPGTVAVRRRRGPSPGVVEHHRGADGDLLGYFAEGPLADSASVFDRWAAGLAELRRAHGFEPPGPRPPGAIGELFMSRAGATAPAGRTDPVWPTFVVDLPGTAVVGGHPDLLPAAAQLGFAARVGPSIARRPRIERCAVHGLGGTVGHASVTPGPADEVAETDGEHWWGGRPDHGARLLVRWRSRGQDRCTDGRLPLQFRRGRLVPDPGAVLLGTLGWARAPQGEGRDLVELYHPGRDTWMVTADPDAAGAFGFRFVSALASLDAERSPLHVRLRTSYDRRRGSHRLHLVAAEAVGETGWVDGWVRLATTPGPEVAGATDGRASPDAAVLAGAPTTPWPGATLLVSMAHAHQPPVVTSEPWRLVAEGWECGEVLGYAAPAVDEVAVLRARAAAAAEALRAASLADRAMTAGRRAVRAAFTASADRAARLASGRPR